MRIALMIGGASVAVAAVSFALWKSAETRANDPLPTAATLTSPSSARLGPAASAKGPLASRELGFRLLGLPDPEAVRSGMATLVKAAEQGDVEAELALGRIYLQGHPAVPKDAARAREWFLRAEAAHHPSAAYFLGVMSQNGEGAKADPVTAARWFAIAAEEGSPDAMFLLANAYRAGRGVPKSDAKALELYGKAGEMEYPAALQALSMAYLHGELGLEPDDAESRRYSMEAEHAVRHPPMPP